MTLLEKLKINIDYLLGKADLSLYTEDYKNHNLSREDWQKRWEIFGNDDCGFVWYGVDAEGNLAEFGGDEAYIPETLFKDVSLNRKLTDFFNDLPEITISIIPKDLRYELRWSADNTSSENSFWKKGANKGIFIFEEFNNENLVFKSWNSWKNPYELLLLPEKPLKVFDLPNKIQQLLKSYHFENLNFRDCQFLDISKYFYCEK